MTIRSATHFILLATLVLAVGCESDISRRVDEHSSSMAVFVPQDEARQRAFPIACRLRLFEKWPGKLRRSQILRGRYKSSIHFFGGSACSGEGAFGIGRKRR